MPEILPKFSESPWLHHDGEILSSSKRLFARMLLVSFEDGEIPEDNFHEFLHQFLDSEKNLGDAYLLDWIARKSSDLKYWRLKHPPGSVKSRKERRTGQHTKIYKAFIFYVQHLARFVLQDHPEASQRQVARILDVHLRNVGARGSLYSSVRSIEWCLNLT